MSINSRRIGTVLQKKVRHSISWFLGYFYLKTLPQVGFPCAGNWQCWVLELCALCRLCALCVQYCRLCRLAGAGRWWDHGTSCVQYCTVRGTMAPGKERKLGRTEARTLSVFLLRSPRLDSTTVPQFVDILVGFDDCSTSSKGSMIDTKRKDSKQFYLQHTLCSYTFLHYVLFQHRGLPPSPPSPLRFSKLAEDIFVYPRNIFCLFFRHSLLYYLARRDSVNFTVKSERQIWQVNQTQSDKRWLSPNHQMFNGETNIDSCTAMLKGLSIIQASFVNMLNFAFIRGVVSFILVTGV